MRENKENIIGVIDIDLGSPKSKNATTKFNRILSVAHGICNQVPLPNSILTHKSYVNKYLVNAASKSRNQDLGIPTRCIILVPHNIG